MSKIIKIEPITVEEYNVHVINSIKAKYPKLRQKSKTPTFALTYMANASKLCKILKMDNKEALDIYNAYHDLYKVSDAYSAKRLEQAKLDHFITVAFGLRIRCSNVEPFKRTLNNAFGQSYGMLSTRALIEFGQIVRNSKYKYDILPANSLHDALYFKVRNDVNVIKFCNDTLTKTFQWQEDPAIKHDKVHLFGELNIYYPNWSNEITLDNDLSFTELQTKLNTLEE